MAQGYYTLEEACSIVKMSGEELKHMARRGELRSFQDRGTWRFRIQDIQELARRLGLTSDPDLVLGEAPAPHPTDSPVRGTAKGREAEVFDFSLGGEEDVGIGVDLPGESPSGKSGSKSGPKTPKSAPKSPRPAGTPPGSDSDVRLVAQGSNFELQPDSDVKIVQDAGPPKQVKKKTSGLGGPKSPRPVKPDSGKSKTGLASAPPAADSGVRLVPMDSDSDVKIVGGPPDSGEIGVGRQPPKSSTDSDIRLEQQSKQPPPSDELLTDEINLDELEKKQQQKPKKKAPQVKARPKQPEPQFPAASPFELSEPDVHLPAPSSAEEEKVKPDSSDFDLTPASEKSALDDSSSDFDLTPAKPEASSSDEFRLDLPEDDAVALGERPAQLKGSDSGIRLDNPSDSGISLEQGGEGSDEIEFELSLDAESSTPKPGHPGAPDSDSEFELTLDTGSPLSDSDSEFELTLDDSGGLSPLEEGQSDKDIFTTDLDVPALEEDSGSQAVALTDSDTDLESSDFDLAISDDDIAIDEESGSQVVALDEDEEVDAAAATVARRPARRADQEFADLEEEEIEEEFEEPARAVVKEKLLPAAPWGAMPVALMLPCAIILFLVGLMGFELVQTMSGYRQPGPVTKMIGGLLGQKIQ
jgi:hypothetical protein